ncbi:unnamed protein product [Fraxinus pennsylvanica]|uniref:Uncharacterized protein n=1 Tax=Fraxinus pennsylvanica TaxID=56036 RepID=A0AAD1ZBV6_9LAMI|nr:unnamed protein product [Fraxinus pennsylvanica]
MGSSVPQFEELNQYPESTSSSSKILPILGPKLESIDEHSPYLQPLPTPIYAMTFTSFMSSSKMLSPILITAPLFLSKNSETQLSNFTIPAQRARQYIRGALPI